MVSESADSYRPSEFPQQQESKFLKMEIVVGVFFTAYQNAEIDSASATAKAATGCDHGGVLGRAPK